MIRMNDDVNEDDWDDYEDDDDDNYEDDWDDYDDDDYLTLYPLVLYVIDDNNIDEDEPAIYYGTEDDDTDDVSSSIVNHVSFGKLKRMSNRVANMLG